jgi:hypothetical protein
VGFKEVCKVRRKIKKRCVKAVGLELIIFLLIGTMIQSTVSFELISNEIVEKISKEDKPELKDKKYSVEGSGTIYYIFPENTERFEGTKWELENCLGINGWINDTNIKVENFWLRGVYKSSYLFILSYQPFRLYFLFNSFRFFLPKLFTIKNYTGNIYCEFWSIPHGPAGTNYELSGNADGIKIL